MRTQTVKALLAAPTDDAALRALLLAAVHLCGGRDDMTDEAVVEQALRGARD